MTSYIRAILSVSLCLTHVACATPQELGTDVFFEISSHSSDNSQPNSNTPSAPTKVSTNLEEHTINTLSQEPSWTRLLLYPDKAQKSTMTDPSFFVSPQGSYDAKAELIANIDALYTDPKFACRFPARTHWLKHRLPQLNTPDVACPEFDDWVDMLDVKQLSLIHAEEHNSRLTSAFAHTLIRLDNTRSLTTGDPKFAFALNFANDNSPTVKPTLSDLLKGNLDGKMTIEPYQPKQDQYLLKDGRDIWQYTLTLTQQEIDQILRHVWEIKPKTRHYNFLTQNCATEVLRFVDLVRPKSALLDTHHITSPQKAAQTLATANILGATTYHPSARTKQQAIINAKSSLTLDNIPILPNRNNPVDFGTKTHRAMMYAIFDNNHAVGVQLRGANQDLLDRPQGKRAYLDIEIAKLDIRHQHTPHHTSTMLQEATLLDVLALNPIGSSQADTSWGAHAKLVRTPEPNSHLVGSIGGQIGHSVSFGKAKVHTGELPNTLCYGLATATSQVGKLPKGYRVGLGGRFGCVYHASDRLRLHADITTPLWYHTTHYWSPSMSLIGQYDLSQNYALRSGYRWQKHHPSQWTIAAIRYF